jgi:acyl-homoserine lactone acylase PvdQ
MKKFLFALLLLPLYSLGQPFTTAEINRWQKQAQQVTIIRDNWGIPHVYGKTDADAVFGLLYAQCEDDFKRVEMNFIEKLGRMAEVKGESSLYDDLYIRLIIDSADAIADYNKSPQWMKTLLQAWADGINYYLYKNPQVKPALLTRFKPWYHLLWTDGSIGAINTGSITQKEVKEFYGSNNDVSYTPKSKEERADARLDDLVGQGSNGFAIAPSRSASGNALLYINPHTTFYFRPEVQMSSNEGLQVYGAVTWGQFFIYQGFNQHCGFMHTSANVDVADLYELNIVREGSKLFYPYNKALRPLKEKQVLLRYKTETGIQTKTIKTYYSHHGPVMARQNNRWIAVRSYNRSLNGLMQCWMRNKAKGLEDYKKVMALRGNTSNNTVFADAKGNIAYWHGNYIPKRNPAINWSKVQDGSTSKTEWQGLHTVDETVHLYNPPNGWIQNCNSTPFTAAGTNSPKKEKYPNYMAPDGENFRGINAVRVLENENAFTIDKLIAAGYNRKLSAFEILIPALVNLYDKNKADGHKLNDLLKEPIEVLRRWDYNSSDTSVATAIAIEWAQKLSASLQRVYIDEGWDDQVTANKKFAATATWNEMLLPLADVVNDFKTKYGKWQVAWGEINRYQRISSDITQQYNDEGPSTPVPFASADWGMLPSYKSLYFNGTKKRYGVHGNSFVCAVEFGKRIKAKSLLAGGVSGNSSSPHFNDQLEMYCRGEFKDVLFYTEDVMKNATVKYHPGGKFIFIEKMK